MGTACSNNSSDPLTPVSTPAWQYLNTVLITARNLSGGLSGQPGLQDDRQNSFGACCIQEVIVGYVSALASGPSFTKDLSDSQKGTARELEAPRLLSDQVLCPFPSSCCKSAPDDGEKQFACVKEGFPSVACVVKNDGVSFPLKQIWVIPSAPEKPDQKETRLHT